MAHLIRTLVGEDDINKLTEAYVVLAEAYLEHRAGNVNSSSDENTFDSLRTRVLASEEKVPVGEMCKHKCSLINTDFERPVELFQ